MAMQPKKKTTTCKVAIRELKNDPPWRRLTKVYRQLLKPSGKFAYRDLMKALKSGELRCVQRIETDLKYAKERPPSFWKSLPWPGKLYFNRLGTHYDPHYYVWRPWEVLPVPAPQSAEASKPERKRAKGGGSKSMYTDEEKERGKAVYLKMLRDDSRWKSATQEAVALHVKEKAKLLGNWKTVYRNIIEPVNAGLD
jgi:hypothetical protein